MFLLVSCSFAFQYLLCFVHDQDQQTKKRNRTKTYVKETGEFHNQSRFSNYALMVNILKVNDKYIKRKTLVRDLKWHLILYNN